MESGLKVTKLETCIRDNDFNCHAYREEGLKVYNPKLVLLRFIREGDMELFWNTLRDQTLEFCKCSIHNDYKTGLVFPRI